MQNLKGKKTTNRVFYNNNIMRLIIESNYETLSQWAAKYVIDRINAAQPTAEHPFGCATTEQSELFEQNPAIGK